SLVAEPRSELAARRVVAEADEPYRVGDHGADDLPATPVALGAIGIEEVDEPRTFFSLTHRRRRCSRLRISYAICTVSSGSRPYSVASSRKRGSMSTLVKSSTSEAKRGARSRRTYSAARLLGSFTRAWPVAH